MEDFLDAIVEIGRAASQVERAALRHQRQVQEDYEKAHRATVRSLKAAEKQQELQLAELEYENYLATIASLESVHVQCSEPIAWQSILDEPRPDEPEPPIRRDDFESEALLKLTRYEPTFTDRLLGKDDKTRAELERKIKESIADDDRAHRAAMAKHANKTQEWAQLVARWATRRSLAQKTLAGDAATSIAVLEGLSMWAEIAERASRIHFEIDDPETVVFDVCLADDRVVPTDQVKLLKSGKASRKPHAKRRSNEIYQDFICGASLRIARETFAALPVPSTVLITVHGGLLDTSTGTHEEAPLLSVSLTREVFATLNWELLDASDSMANFEHRMKFSAAEGFAPCEPLPKTTGN